MDLSNLSPHARGRDSQLGRCAEILKRWRLRRDEFKKLQASVDGARICDEVLADLEAIAKSGLDDLLSITQAAHESGYSTRQLSRDVRAGRIQNFGRGGAPKLRRGDLPRKPGHLSPRPQPAIVGTATQIARSVVTLS